MLKRKVMLVTLLLLSALVFSGCLPYDPWGDLLNGQISQTPVHLLSSNSQLF